MLSELRRRHRKAAIVTLSANDDAAAIALSMRSGSAGFIHKAVPRGQCIEAIGRVLAGENVIERTRNEASSAVRLEQAAIALTTRQREVLGLLAQGASNKAIARARHLASHCPTPRLQPLAPLRCRPPKRGHTQSTHPRNAAARLSRLWTKQTFRGRLLRDMGNASGFTTPRRPVFAALNEDHHMPRRLLAGGFRRFACGP